MKILFVANEVPYPPDNGVRIPIYHAMRLMYRAGHHVALAVLTAEIDEVEARFTSLTANFRRGSSFVERIPGRHSLEMQLTAILGKRLLYVERYRSDSFRRRLTDCIGEFCPDVIHFDLIPMAQYQNVTPVGVGTVASITDSYALTLENALHAGYFKGFEYLYKKWQYRSTRQYEKKIYAKFQRVHVMSEIDKAYLLQLKGNLSVSVIPNGAEDSLFDIPTLRVAPNLMQQVRHGHQFVAIPRTLNVRSRPDSDIRSFFRVVVIRGEKANSPKTPCFAVPWVPGSSAFALRASADAPE